MLLPALHAHPEGLTSMKEFIWRLIARLLARPAIADLIIRRAQRTPYQHIMSADGTEMYMGRWWLLNPYDRDTHKARFRWLPWSVRVHHIMRADQDRDLHDHPWDARTVILRGAYLEERLLPDGLPATTAIERQPGDTATLRYGEFHRIEAVSAGGVFTLFITSPWRGEWGFLVGSEKVHWRDYTGERP